MRNNQINIVLDRLHRNFNYASRVVITKIPRVNTACTIEVVSASGVDEFWFQLDGSVVFRRNVGGSVVANYVLSEREGHQLGEIIPLLEGIYLVEWRPMVGFLQIFYESSEVCNYTVRGASIVHAEVVRSGGRR